MSFHPKERERWLWKGEQKQQAGLIAPPLPCTPFCISGKKALMKTSGDFRLEADTQKMSFFPPTFPSYPSAGPHNSEEPSCGNVIVWCRWSKQCDRML